MLEFRSENRLPSFRRLLRIGPIIVIVVMTFGLATLRISEETLTWAVAILLGLTVVGYFSIRALMQRRTLHVKIGSDWIRIRRGTRLLSAPLHSVAVEQSMLFDNRFKISHPRKKLSFTISVDNFPADQRSGLSALLRAQAKPGTSVLANFIGTDPPAAQ